MPGGEFFAGPSGRLLCAVRESIVIVDAQQTIVALNPAAEALLGCPAHEALGRSLARFVPAVWRERHAAQVRDYAASVAAQGAQAALEAQAHRRRVSVQRADGTVVPADIVLSRIEMAAPDGARPLVAAMLHDATAERALEDEVARIERRMRAVFELSPSAVWICEDDLLVYANRAAARLVGLDQVDALLGTRVCDLLDADSHARLRAELERTLAGQTLGALVQARLRRPDGAVREVEIALAALPDHGHRSVQLVVNDVTERRREAADLERSRRALRELSASVVEAREEERRRIARELHDELGQRLTALKIDLAALAQSAHLAATDRRVAAMQATLDDTVASVRRLSSDLRPLMLDDLGLSAAIEWLARDASQRMGISVRAKLPLAEPALDERVAIALYRTVQEALTNVARHAGAHSVEVELAVHEGQLVLGVADDGRGLREGALQRRGSFGLLGLHERARLLGGTLEIGARPGGGTMLTMRVPARVHAPGVRPEELH
jgi:PAS domain S-box-containing protein